MKKPSEIVGVHHFSNYMLESSHPIHYSLILIIIIASQTTQIYPSRYSLHYNAVTNGVWFLKVLPMEEC